MTTASIKKTLQWDDLRYFLALYRTKKLVAAGKYLRVDYTTVGRRVRELESVLNVKLFEKTEFGFKATRIADKLLGYAESVENALFGLEEDVCDPTVNLTGTVRVGSPEIFSNYFLADHLPWLIKKNPGLEIDLLSMKHDESFSRREVDVMIALERPTSGRLVSRLLTNYQLGLYAAKSYIENNELIRVQEDLLKHQFISCPDSVFFSNYSTNYWLNNCDQIPLRVGNLATMYKAVVQGHGLCVLPHFMADKSDDIVPVLPGNVQFEGDFWLVMHEDLRDVRRIRKVADFIVDSVAGEEKIFKSG